MDESRRAAIKGGVYVQATIFARTEARRQAKGNRACNQATPAKADPRLYAVKLRVPELWLTRIGYICHIVGGPTYIPGGNAERCATGM